MFLAHRDKTDGAYAPSFRFEGERLSDAHGAIHEQVADVDGWLEPADSLKLYELGYLAAGPFLEIGTFRGKSTTVLATALRDAGRHVQFYSLDIELSSLESARATLAERGLGRHVVLVHASATALFRTLPDFAPRFVFVDGDHSEAGVGRDLACLETRVPDRGLLLFHDFRNPRNEDPADKEYGVPQAIRSSWVDRDCEFAGVFGCTALYRRVRGPGAAVESAPAPPLLRLVALDRPGIRLLVEVARPVKRWARAALARVAGKRR